MQTALERTSSRHSDELDKKPPEQHHKTINGARRSSVKEAINAEGFVACSMCGQHEPQAIMVDMRTSEVMKHTLATYWKMPTASVESTLASVCVQCVYKINAHQEMTRTLEVRLQRCVQNTACENKKPMDTTPTTGHRKKDKRKRSKPQQHKNAALPPSPSIITSTPIRKVPATSANDLTAATPSCNGTASSSVTDTTLVTPSIVRTAEIVEKSEGVNSSPNSLSAMPDSNTSLNAMDGSVTPPPYSPLVTSQQSPPAQSHPIVELQAADATSEAEPAAAPSQSNESPPVVSSYRARLDTSTQSMLCVVSERPESTLITESGGQITRHAAQRLTCQYCPRSYTRKANFAKHIRRCSRLRPKSAASKRSTKSPIRQAESATQDVDVMSTQHEEAPRDRARVFHCSECTVTSDSIIKLREHKRTHLPRYNCDSCGSEFRAPHEFELHCVICAVTQQASADSEELPEMRVTRSRSRAAASRAGSVRYASSTHTGGRCSSNRTGYWEANDDEDDDDDAESVPDTMYTKRMRYTGDWVEDHSASASISSAYTDHVYDADTQINTFKEYDFYLLDRLKAQIHSGYFTCTVPGCQHKPEPTLVEMMIHDYVDHYKSSWFYCQKCGYVFTSKVFLDYHLDRQNGGRFICYKCGDIFEFQHQLDRHFIQHTKCINYRCNYCNFEFLNEYDLLQHCENEQHHPNGERKLICYDPSMSIVQEQRTSSEPDATTPRVFTERIMEMSLPRMPSLRPMTLPGHKPYRRHVGSVIFKHQKNPNCWGWKNN